MENTVHRSQLHEELGNDPNKSISESKEAFKRKTLTTNGLMVIGNDERGYFAGIGNSRISEVYKTWEEVEQLVKDKDWEILGAYIAVIVESYMRIRDEQMNQTAIEGKYDIGTDSYNVDKQLKLDIK